MRNKTLLTRHLLPAIAAAVLFSSAACGPKKPEPTPTMSVNAIYTAAARTLEAQMATQKALTPPTATPTNTAFPTLPPAATLPPIAFGTATMSAGTGTGNGCDNAIFVSDVTIPDGTEVAAGKKFVKTWSLLNKGTCNWDTGYKLAFLDGDQMGGADTPVGQAVPSGTVLNISVTLTAPDAAGNFTGRWQMENATGGRFGNIVTVVIKVGSGATSTPGGATETPGTPVASATPTP